MANIETFYLILRLQKYPSSIFVTKLLRFKFERTIINFKTHLASSGTIYYISFWPQPKQRKKA